MSDGETDHGHSLFGLSVSAGQQTLQVSCCSHCVRVLLISAGSQARDASESDLQRQRYKEYHLDEYPAGTNADVAVISFTGDDMEDAMILDKASVDRWFAHGRVYKTEQRFLSEG